MVADNQSKTFCRSPDAKVRWLGPLPIWSRPSPVGLRLQQDEKCFAQPAILRFDHDDFMQEYIDTLQNESERLGEWLAQPETWREPMKTPKLTPHEPQPDSKVAFLYDETYRLTKTKKPLFPTALNLQPLKGALAKRRSLPSVPALSEEQLPLKLYQSTHKRHYLVSASLISEALGWPDCEPELSRSEKAGFVLRRLLPPKQADGERKDNLPLDQWDEYAFIPSPRSNSWRRIGKHRNDPEVPGVLSLAPGEEQLPLFPVSFLNTCDERRRLLSGVIPVSRREDWVGARIGEDLSVVQTSHESAATEGSTLAGFLFQTDVVAPWKLLLEQAETKKQASNKTFDNFDGDDEDAVKKNDAAKNKDKQRLLRSARDEIQTGSWYVLLDFAKFLQKHLTGIWQVISGEAELATLNDKEQVLVTMLQATRLSWHLASIILQPKHTRFNYQHIKWSLADALVAAAGSEQGLEAVDETFIRFDEAEAELPLDTNWPDFLFPLADPELTAPTPAVATSELTGLSGLDRSQTSVDVLSEIVEALLPPGEAAAELIDTVQLGDTREAWFVVRCVYQRPNCGPLFPVLVSEPSQKFQMAPFFDPDAPTRPLRIPMPVDISPAGLRKYQKNTGFIMSDMLCGKIARIRKMTFADLVLSVLPWPFHKDLPDPSSSGSCKDGDGNAFGMICSLSIPIVTLCALILMIIMVALFDLFFRWIPYLFTCLPIPGKR